MGQPNAVIVLGATGSIGTQALAVVAEHPERFRVEGLAAHRRAEALVSLAQRFRPRWVALTDAAAAAAATQALAGSGIRVYEGANGLVEAVRQAQPAQVLAAISGFAGLESTLAAVERGLPVLLANKETLVAAGELVTKAAAVSGSRLVPVDSEHSAIFQCLAGSRAYRRLILTCSGGPFRGRRRGQLAAVTVEEALRHPTWKMGPAITVDSATLMNKGLEIIEAHWLFGAPYDAIEVLIHPQSIVHSLVEFVDGAVMAQLGPPDMRVPIEVALAWPERLALSVSPLDLTRQPLYFEPVDSETFPAPDLARRAGMAGGLYPAVLNAANEAAREAFLAGTIGFLDIVGLVAEALERFPGGAADSLEAVRAADGWARQAVRQRLAQRT